MNQLIQELKEPKDKVVRMEIDPLLKLSMVEQIIRKNRFVVPVPNRKTLQSWIMKGKWDGEQDEETGVWYVRQSSFIKWARALHPQLQRVAA